MEKTKLSAEAQQLIELTGGRGFGKPAVKVTEVLQAHPELMAGLDEYLTWYGECCRADSQTSVQAPVSHPLSGLSKTLENQGKSEPKKE